LEKPGKEKRTPSANERSNLADGSRQAVKLTTDGGATAFTGQQAEAVAWACEKVYM